jgi:phenylalanyl-tRNA synthetase alpha chain
MQELEQIIAERAKRSRHREHRRPRAGQGALPRQGGLAHRAAEGLGKLSAEERPKAGAAINQAKARVEELLQARRDAILARELDSQLAASRST